MDSSRLNEAMKGLLGFRVTERENDAVVEFFTPDGGKVRAVRPAHAAEVTMYLRLLGFVTRIDEMSAEADGLRASNAALIDRISHASQEVDAAVVRARQAEQKLDDSLAANNVLENAINKMGIALQSADAQIKALMVANSGLGEEQAETRRKQEHERENFEQRMSAALHEIERLNKENQELTGLLDDALKGLSS